VDTKQSHALRSICTRHNKELPRHVLDLTPDGTAWQEGNADAQPRNAWLFEEAILQGVLLGTAMQTRCTLPGILKSQISTPGCAAQSK
jgi:hypothetical protein